MESSVCPLSEKKHGKHPTQKPLGILRRLIELVTNPNDVILDPFMGSGSTCVAAVSLGRRYLGVELDEKYLRIAKARIEEIEKI